MKHLSKISKALFFLLFVFSCTSEKEPINNINASFEINSNEVLVGQSIKFTNTSSDITSSVRYEWDFGDGNSSTEKSPSHTYSNIGSGNLIVELKLVDGNQERKSNKEILLSFSNDIVNRKTLTEKLSDAKILTCAHRANQEKGFPENSIGAINNDIANGVEMIEIDIRETKDGQLILMHDETIDRTTDGSGNVSNYTLQDIQKFKLYNSSGVLTNETVPSLKEVLVITRGKIYIDLDISKKVSFEAVYPIVKQFGMLKQVLFYSSKLDVIKTMINKDPEVIAMPIIDGDDRFSDYENLQNIKVVHYTNDSFNQTLVDKAKAKGWSIFMNAYVNTTTTPDDDNYGQVDKVSTLSGNIIQTDHAVLVKKHLNN